ncbi:MAG: L,D-transpeptidase [Desulfomonile sp.]|nr:L,D-transpeptidase [Desulfomonile sp.]
MTTATISIAALLMLAGLSALPASAAETPLLDSPDWTAFPSPYHQPVQLHAPTDPCLPPDVTNWRELTLRQEEQHLGGKFSVARIVIRRDIFELVLEGVRSDGTTEALYTTKVGLGDADSPTPPGNFVLNHVYCYPDLVLYDDHETKIPNVYNGFLAPLMLCDDNGRCERHRDLGIHGFDAAAHPNRARIRTATVGPVSSGCIRVPDPCAFKTALIRLVGVGPLRKNERGCYHWLRRPVDVWIVDDDVTLVSLVTGGLAQVGKGLKSLLDIFVSDSRP